MDPTPEQTQIYQAIDIHFPLELLGDGQSCTVSIHASLSDIRDILNDAGVESQVEDQELWFDVVGADGGSVTVELLFSESLDYIESVNSNLGSQVMAPFWERDTAYRQVWNGVQLRNR